MPISTASSQRRQLWALAIRENELRYERDKEDARVEYDARQKELLQWMIDEEAGRHDAADILMRRAEELRRKLAHRSSPEVSFVYLYLAYLAIGVGGQVTITLSHWRNL